jgi:hypothetical protein
VRVLAWLGCVCVCVCVCVCSLAISALLLRSLRLLLAARPSICLVGPA